MAGVFSQNYFYIVIAVKERIWLFYIRTITKKWYTKYILDQEVHYHKITFKEEYIGFLKKFEIEFDEKFLFEWNEE